MPGVLPPNRAAASGAPIVGSNQTGRRTATACTPHAGWAMFSDERWAEQERADTWGDDGLCARSGSDRGHHRGVEAAGPGHRHAGGAGDPAPLVQAPVARKAEQQAPQRSGQAVRVVGQAPWASVAGAAGSPPRRVLTGPRAARGGCSQRVLDEWLHRAPDGCNLHRELRHLLDLMRGRATLGIFTNPHQHPVAVFARRSRSRAARRPGRFRRCGRFEVRAPEDQDEDLLAGPAPKRGPSAPAGGRRRRAGARPARAVGRLAAVDRRAGPRAHHGNRRPTATRLVHRGRPHRGHRVAPGPHHAARGRRTPPPRSPARRHRRALR